MNVFAGIAEPRARRVPPDPSAGARPPAGFALWELGFRPFYLLASVFAALSIGVWALQLAGVLRHAVLQGPVWHAHEMLFGFVLAVVVGFLFTAGRNWSNRPTPRGLPLAGLALLWIAGRMLVLTPFGWAAAIVNAAFPLLAAIGLAGPLVGRAQPPKLFLRRPAAAARGRRTAGPSGAARRDPLSRVARHPGCARRRSVPSDRDGRARDPDVHEQRRAGRPRLDGKAG